MILEKRLWLVLTPALLPLTLFACTAELDDEGEDPTEEADSPSTGSGGTPSSEPDPSSGGAQDTGSGGRDTSTGGQGSEEPITCESPEPPASVAAWVDESWDAQLNGNIKNRRAWLLDSAILGGGEINLCMRWGASSAPSTAVKQKTAAAVERWMNDWFKALGSYGCFPYPDGVKVKITGWAVPPGKESWVSDLDDSIAVYTETDGDGQPKCPDTCSFFTNANWNHEFPRCPGGEAFHTDYWIWVSDALPGGGAAAVGGDWGLRMPVTSFVNSLDRQSDFVIEHEIGHGFGFQDYYDWTGSRPTGGSLMIVGSTGGQSSPTLGDTWLIRRTWKETQALRGW